MDAVRLSRLVRSKVLSPVEVVDAVLDRMERLEPMLHAFCTPAPEQAREEARRLQEALRHDDTPRPLAGVPVGIKDLLCTKYLRSTFGSKAYRDFVPEEDDVVVERLKAAGGIVLGKTNVAELGFGGVGHNPLFETTRNPWNIGLTSGGSSAGSGVAVATGMGPIAIGTDGGGSIRIPASFCGVFGLKPSMGRVPLYPTARDERFPGISGWESIEHVGPLSRSVADSALVLSVISGPDSRDRHSLPGGDVDWMECVEGELGGLRIAYSRDWGYATVDSEVGRVVEEALEVFTSELGCLIESADPGWDDPYDAFRGLIALDTDLDGMRALADEYEEDMSPHLVEFLRERWTAEEFTNAVQARKALTNRMWRFMAEYDLLITPTVAVPPFAINVQGPTEIAGRPVHEGGWLPFTYPMNLTGQPAASVPAGWTDNGLPVGMQIVGRHLDDALVLKASAALETVRPWKNCWPPIMEEMGRV